MGAEELSYRLATQEEILSYPGINRLHGIFSTYNGQLIYVEKTRYFQSDMDGPLYELVASPGEHFVLRTGKIVDSILAYNWRDVIYKIGDIERIERCRCAF